MSRRTFCDRCEHVVGPGESLYTLKLEPVRVFPLGTTGTALTERDLCGYCASVIRQTIENPNERPTDRRPA